MIDVSTWHVAENPWILLLRCHTRYKIFYLRASDPYAWSIGDGYETMSMDIVYRKTTWFVSIFDGCKFRDLYLINVTNERRKFCPFSFVIFFLLIHSHSTISFRALIQPKAYCSSFSFIIPRLFEATNMTSNNLRDFEKFLREESVSINRIE